MSDDRIRANRHAWDAKTPHHLASDFYDVPSFLAGGYTLKRLELELCGCVRGLDLLHLQCHFGLDTLSWGRLGARVTGVDFSASAVAAARTLAGRSGIAADFVEADVQNLPNQLEGGFDLAVSTYGTLCWLNDLDAWARGIARVLRPGGRFVLVEFHPILDVMHEGCLTDRKDYFGDAPRECRSRGTYADRTVDLQLTQYFWQHPISQVVTALLEAGFSLKSFAEYPFCSYKIIPELAARKDGYWHSPTNPCQMPYLYSVVAVK